MDYKDKVVLITGSARGIGKTTARSFLQRGAKVCICDINSETGNKTSEEFEAEFGKNRVIFKKCDVTKNEDFEATYNECEKSLGTVDILVNNAGIVHKELKQIIAVNFEGVVRGTELAIKRMGKHNGGRGGHVVNIGSCTGLLPMFLLPYYSSTKAAVIHFSRIMGSEFHQSYSRVSVLCVCPGGVATDLALGDYLEETAYNNYVLDAAADFKKNISCLKPEELGETVIRVIDENKSGEVAFMDKDFGFSYVPPSLDTSKLVCLKN